MIEEFNKMKQTMQDVVDDVIFYDPPQRIIIRGFGASDRMR
jgi:hypothetical protein